ncbi:MAG: hypothetical protein C5B49_07335 [Bdellovibrio sp.]|nr:MAG: hypothetical protein C5B49_07335 [Bdellovibrio sp.]
MPCHEVHRIEIPVAVYLNTLLAAEQNAGGQRDSAHTETATFRVYGWSDGSPLPFAEFRLAGSPGAIASVIRAVAGFLDTNEKIYHVPKETPQEPSKEPPESADRIVQTQKAAIPSMEISEWSGTANGLPPGFTRISDSSGGEFHLSISNPILLLTSDGKNRVAVLSGEFFERHFFSQIFEELNSRGLKFALPVLDSLQVLKHPRGTTKPQSLAIFQGDEGVSRMTDLIKGETAKLFIIDSSPRESVIIAPLNLYDEETALRNLFRGIFGSGGGGASGKSE